MRQDVTDYKLELKISVFMLVNLEFRILTWNFEFWLNFKFLFADHSRKILISKVEKFYTGLTMIIQKNRHVNFESKFNTFPN